MSNFEDIIRSRRSVRTFEKSLLSDSVLDSIDSYIRDIPNPFNIPCTFQLIKASDYNLDCPVLVNAMYYLLGKVTVQDHFEEAFGFSMQKALMYIESLGLGTVFIGGTMDRPAFEKVMGLSDNERMPCISPVGIPAKKMALRETLMRKGVKADNRLPETELFFDTDFATALNEQNPVCALALKMVQRAPSAVNRQPWRIVRKDGAYHFYEKQTLPSSDRTGDLQKIDLGIALASFTEVLNENNTAWTLSVNDPMIDGQGDLQYCFSIIL
ncbi:MAG: hypothetical protein IKS32_12295 [Solobacterium sp.]|nr:hypothetical protein [Solobacterium sp.]